MSMLSLHFNLKKVVVLLSLCISTYAIAGDGLILPMPGKKNKPKITKKQTQADKEKKSKKLNEEEGTIIHLPTRIDPKPKQSPKSPPETSENPADIPLIQITPPEIPADEEDFPIPPDEIVTDPDDVIDEILEPVVTSDSQTNEGTEEGQYPIFPKDTGSAIFMVMKSWQCTDYDGGALLTQAVGVYSQEADDQFKIEGLPEGGEVFIVNIEEEDITLDELLDIMAQQAGRDWGVDITGKTIYFYPKGISTDDYNVW